MTTVEEKGLSTDHSRAVVDGAHTHGVKNAHQEVAPEGSRAERKTSFRVNDFDELTGREEEWRFTPIDAFGALLDTASEFSTQAVDVVAAPEVVVTTVAREVLSADDAAAAASSSSVASGEGALAGTHKTAGLAGTPKTAGLAGTPGDRAAALAWERASETVLVTIPRDVVASRDTHITLRGNGELAAGHVAIVAEQFAQAVVVLDHQGSGMLSQNVEIVVGDGAHLTVVSVQDQERGAVHLSAHRAKLGRDAYLKHIVVTLGGEVVRITPEAAFTGTGGEVDMVGLYLADGGQHQEHRLFVDHGVPNCKSRVTYKGALQGKGAHTVWVGDVLIRAAAQGTDTYELNRNLVLTDGARADSVPNLEIETGDIEGAGHASATGRFDDEQLFYLRSRGIPEEAARRLVVRGFFAELVHQIGVPDVEARLMAAIEAELDRSLSA